MHEGANNACALEVGLGIKGLRAVIDLCIKNAIIGTGDPLCRDRRAVPIYCRTDVGAR